MMALEAKQGVVQRAADFARMIEVREQLWKLRTLAEHFGGRLSIFTFDFSLLSMDSSSMPRDNVEISNMKKVCMLKNKIEGINLNRKFDNAKWAE